MNYIQNAPYETLFVHKLAQAVGKFDSEPRSVEETTFKVTAQSLSALQALQSTAIMNATFKAENRSKSVQGKSTPSPAKESPVSAAQPAVFEKTPEDVKELSLSEEHKIPMQEEHFRRISESREDIPVPIPEDSDSDDSPPVPPVDLEE
jgi:hypothetical protein